MPNGNIPPHHMTALDNLPGPARNLLNGYVGQRTKEFPYYKQWLYNCNHDVAAPLGSRAVFLLDSSGPHLVAVVTYALYGGVNQTRRNGGERAPSMTIDVVQPKLAVPQAVAGLAFTEARVIGFLGPYSFLVPSRVAWVEYARRRGLVQSEDAPEHNRVKFFVPGPR